MSETKLVGIRAEVILDRTVYIEVPAEATDDEIIKKASEEIILPHNALYMADSALKRTGLKLDHLDLKDWEVDKCNYKIIE